SGLTLTATKMKDAELPLPLNLELVTVDLPGMFDEFDNPVTSAALEVTDADLSALIASAKGKSRAAIRNEDHRQNVLRVLANHPEGETRRFIRDAAGLQTTRANEAINSLLADGLIESAHVIKGNRNTPLEGFKIATLAG
ncbi:MAG TPA: hypothetical protein VMY42_10900, partial [Thermoguttaceae bacterium]|nr:hypothetical protein [Thermoguttaceae bacterium]